MTKDQKTLTDESKRKFVKGLTLLVGSTAATAFLTTKSMSVALAHTIESEKTIAVEPLTDGKVFSLNQLKQLKSICAIVIPKTDTLGAAEVNTHGFIDNQLFHCYDKSAQEKAKQLLSLIDVVAEKIFSQSFIVLKQTQQFELLTELDLGITSFSSTERQDFKLLKQLICFGYYTSEVGASQELRYLAVPGGYEGSIAYEKTDASWGSQGLYY